MSDDYGDAADPAAEAASGSLEDRLDTMHRTLSTLGMRIDALVTSTTTYRSALTDRLNEYTELVSKLGRSQAADLEEQRRSNDRAAAELRQGLTSSQEALERMSARIEAMAGDAGSDELLAELRTVREAQDQLGRALTDSLDRFGDRTTGVIEEIRESLLDVASGEVVGALWDEFRGARASIDEMRIAVERAEESARSAADAAQRTDDADGGLEPLRADVTSLTGAVRELLDQAEVVDEGAEVPDNGMLAAVASDVASLRNELARGLVVEPSDALTGAVDQLRADVAGLDTRLQAITELQQAVAELRGAVAEVADAPAPSSEPDPALARVDDGVRDLAQGVADLDARLATLSERLDALDRLESLDRLDRLDRLDGIEDRLDERVAARLAALAPAPGADERLAEQLAPLGAIDGLEHRVAERVAEQVAQQLPPADALDGLEDRLATRLAPAPDDGLAERLAMVDGQLDAVQQRLGEQLGAVEQRLGGMDRHLAGIDEVHRLVGDLRQRIEELAAEPEAPATEPEPAPMSEELEAELGTLRRGVEGVDAELRAMRSGVEDIIARLDEGLVLADEIVPPTAGVPPELADQLAAIRDELTTGLDSLRGLAEARTAEVDLGPVTELLEHVRDDIAAVPGRIEVPAAAEEGERYATLDPDIVDLLREEIRAAGAAGAAAGAGAGGVPEEVLDALRTELVALRRRIKLRAEGEILTDQQLELIAEAVARKLAE